MAKTTDVAPKLLLIDGLSLAYRAFYALPTDLATPNGTVTNAVYGFTSMLVKVLTDEHPDEIVVVFDAPGRTFRDDLDDAYKSGRKETPGLFVPQIPLIHEVIAALRIPTLQIEGVEADDVIATLATRAAAAGSDVVVVTGDRDAYQLVEDPHIKVLYNRRGVSDYVLYDEAGIAERTGVTAGQYPEYAALRGDPSDNLPGVPGIGEKTAAKLVTTYGDLEGIFAHLDELPRSNARTWATRATGCSSTARCRCCVRDVPLDVDPGELRQGQWDRDRGPGPVRSARLPHPDAPVARRARGNVGGGGRRRSRRPRRRGRRDARRRRGARALRCDHVEQRTVRARATLGRRAGHERVARDRARARRARRVHRRRTVARAGGARGARRRCWRKAGRRWSRTGRRS